jgi:2-dehydropantoate 2-reductase
MRILVVGAGGIGGYFGGRLATAGRDVTFLVRPARQAQLARTGLAIRSPTGDLDLANPKTVTADRLNEAFDLVLLSCKAYDLDGAIDAFAPAAGPDTAILPLLNGISHLDRLDDRFGPGAVLGGLCMISTILDPDGRVLHLNDSHTLSFGERDGALSPRIDAIAAMLGRAGFNAMPSPSILQEMWEKWVFIASLAGITCLMRAAIGDIEAAGAADLAEALLAECAAIASHAGFPPRAAALRRSRAVVTARGSGMTASMYRDIERGQRIEADHLIGDLLGRAADPAQPGSLLRVAVAHLKAYEAKRAREAV